MGISTREFADLCRNMGLDPMAELRKVEGVSDQPTERRSKYGAKRKVVDGIEFDSTREANVYVQLKAQQMAGKIAHLELQPEFLLQEAFRDSQGKKHRQVRYRADFEFFRIRPDHMTDQRVVVDVKGFATPVFRLKEKLFRAKYPHISLEVWR